MKTLSLPEPVISPAAGRAIATIGLAIPIGVAIAVTADPLIVAALAVAAGAVAAFGMAGSNESRRSMMLAALAVSFVATGYRLDTGFIVLEPWLVLFPICLAMLVGEVAIGRRSLHLDRIGVLALLVVIAAWLSFFGALDVLTWLKRAMKVTWLFGLYVILVSWLSHEKSSVAFIRASLWGCSVAALAIVGQTMARWIAEGSAEVSGVGGTFANSNEAATYLSIFIVLGLSLYGTAAYKTVLPRRRLLLLVAVAAVGVLFSRSRSGVVGLVMVSAMLFIRAPRVRQLVLGGIAFLLILALTPSTAIFVNRLLGTVGLSGDPDYDAFMQGGNTVRFYLLQLYWAVIKAYPIFGVGAGNYAFIRDLGVELPLAPREAEALLDPDVFNFSSHNGFANWWVETGTLGFVPFVVSLACAMRAVWLARRNEQRPFWRAVATGTFGGLLLFILSNIPGEFGVSEARYWFLLALASVVASQARTCQSRSARVDRDERGVRRSRTDP